MVAAEGRGKRGRGVARQSGKRDVGVEDAHVQGDSGLEEDFVDLLAELVEARVPAANPCPNDASRAPGGEDANSLHRQKKALDRDLRKNRLQFPSEGEFDVPQETESEVKLLGTGPVDATDWFVKCYKRITHFSRKGKCDEEPLGLHRRRRNRLFGLRENLKLRA